MTMVPAAMSSIQRLRLRSGSNVCAALRAGTYVLQLRATATSAQPVAGVARVIASLDDFPMELVS